MLVAYVHYGVNLYRESLIQEKYIPLFEFHGFSSTFSVELNKEVLDLNPCYDVNAVATISSSSRLVSCRTQ